MFLILILGCTDPCSSMYEHGETSTVTAGLVWERTAITDGVCGPAFGEAADLDGDGQVEVVFSNFGRPDGFALADGSVMSLDAESGVVQPLMSTDAHIKWPNGPQLTDMDDDGDLDVLIGLGFLTCQINPWTADCGGIIWLDNDGAWTPRNIVAPGASLFYHHPMHTDIDGDGINDVVAVGESYAGPLGSEAVAEVRWWAGLGGGEFAAEHTVIGQGLGSLPQMWDIDEDGDLDIISGEYFSPDAASYVWMERDGAAWTRHVIDDSVGPTIQGKMIPDLFGDGITRMVGSNHSNTEAGDPWPSEIAAYTPGADPTALWERQVIYDGFVSVPTPTAGAPGIFSAGDIDSDGDIDLLVSGDGDERVVWMEQTEPGAFAVHTLEPSLPQAGLLVIEDFNGDGRMELAVSGYEDNVIFIYTRED